MFITTNYGVIEVVDERSHTLGSADNVQRYSTEVNLDPQGRPSSLHGLRVDGYPLAVFANTGGASGVHQHSALFINELLYLAVGDSIVSIELSPFKVRWNLKVDDATCFGVHYDASRDALLSHGELAVTRFSADGVVLWSAYGADVFSEGFALHPQYVEAIDFEKRSYKFSYDNGGLIV